MSSVLFTRLPFSVNDPSLPQLNSNQVNVLVEYEVGALDHWIFNSGETSLNGVANGTLLVNQDEAAPNAEFGPNYIQFPMPIGQAYTTQFQDSALTEGTYTCVFQYTTTGFDAGDLAFLMGNLDTSSGSNGGGCVYISSNQIQANVRGLGTVNASATVLEEGKWYFVAGSWKDGYGLNYYIGKASGGEFNAAFSSGAKDPNTAWNIGIGNPDYSSGNSDSGALRYGEFALHDRFVGSDDIEGLYLRAKERMLKVGITVE